MSDPRHEAFFKHVVKSETCWHWTRTLHGAHGIHKGPGDPSYRNTHRYCWDLLGNPPLTPQQQLMTRCKTRGCVNPAHQEAVSRGSVLVAARNKR